MEIHRKSLFCPRRGNPCSGRAHVTFIPYRDRAPYLSAVSSRHALGIGLGPPSLEHEGQGSILYIQKAKQLKAITSKMYIIQYAHAELYTTIPHRRIRPIGFAPRRVSFFIQDSDPKWRYIQHNI